MAEIAVSLAVDQLLPLLREEANLLRGIHKEFADIKDELESIQAFLKDADKRAAAEGDNIPDGVRTWVKRVREVAFRIEDVIDEYMILVAPKPCDPGRAALLHKIAHLVKTLIPRHKIASEIQDIKSSVRKIKGRSERYGFQRSFEQGTNNFKGSQNAKWHDPRADALYMDEADVVGFETAKAELIDWLVNGRAERTVISVAGMGGQGKTTLAKKVYDNKVVVGHFDCRAWVIVSQSYSVEGLLRDMLSKFYDPPPKDISKMDRSSLIAEVRNYLQRKRYVVVFDDVWNIHFWNEIGPALIDNKNGSKIFITTRNMDVVVSCKKSSFIQVHELQPLTEKQSLELFNKKAFGIDFDGCCPKELIDVSFEIVKKCQGLPLAIVAIGGLLSIKERNAFEWQKFSENLSSMLKKDSHLIGINEILSFSYDDLPYYLKSCLLYFGIYPEDYIVKSKRLFRQWIAEGFVKEERGKTLEEVAEGYLSELIRRSLVQVSLIKIDGKAKSCRVHDLTRVMILEKFEDLSFCKHISEDGQSSSLSGIIRRLSVATTSSDLTSCIQSSRVRSLLFFANKSSLPVYFVSTFSTKYRLLKVLDFEDVVLLYVPKNLENFIHLKYLRFKSLQQTGCPNSIVMLPNLETLDVRGTYIYKMPKEISKLRKLRHLLGDNISLIQLKDGIGGMTSLLTLWYVNLDGDADEQVKVIRELGKLKQLRELGLVGVREEHGSALSSSINEMQYLEKLQIETKLRGDVIDLNLISPSPMLRNIKLHGKLLRLPEWIPQLQNLVKLRLMCSLLIDDPIKSLQNLQNLLFLTITDYTYIGESLHFQDGGFQKLKELYFGNLDNLNYVVIDKGTLHSLEKLVLRSIPKLKTVPTGIQYLEKLQFLNIHFMPTEFRQSIAFYGGKEHWIVEHVPLVEIYPR